MAATTDLVVRTLHVLGLALLLGGTAGVWLALRTDAADPLALTVRFERAFWLVLGVMVVTGVGNLAAVGAPGPATEWGRTFTAKLAVVVAFLLGSLVRTLAVVRLTGENRTDPQRRRGRLGGDAIREWTARAYGATAGALAVLVVLGEVLAHG